VTTWTTISLHQRQKFRASITTQLDEGLQRCCQLRFTVPQPDQIVPQDDCESGAQDQPSIPGNALPLRVFDQHPMGEGPPITASEPQSASDEQNVFNPVRAAVALPWTASLAEVSSPSPSGSEKRGHDDISGTTAYCSPVKLARTEATGGSVIARDDCNSEEGDAEKISSTVLTHSRHHSAPVQISSVDPAEGFTSLGGDGECAGERVGVVATDVAQANPLSLSVPAAKITSIEQEGTSGSAQPGILHNHHEREAESLRVQNIALNAKVAHQAGRIADLEQANVALQGERERQRAEIERLRDILATVRGTLPKL
jgi:hypothetical protein